MSSRRSGSSRRTASSSTLNDTEVKQLELVKLQIEDEMEEEARKEREKERQRRKLRAFRKAELEFEINKAKTSEVKSLNSRSSIASSNQDIYLNFEDAKSHVSSNNSTNRTEAWINSISPDSDSPTALVTIDECASIQDSKQTLQACVPITSTPQMGEVTSTSNNYSCLKRVLFLVECLCD